MISSFAKGIYFSQMDKRCCLLHFSRVLPSLFHKRYTTLETIMLDNESVCYIECVQSSAIGTIGSHEQLLVAVGIPMEMLLVANLPRVYELGSSGSLVLSKQQMPMTTHNCSWLPVMSFQIPEDELNLFLYYL